MEIRTAQMLSTWTSSKLHPFSLRGLGQEHLVSHKEDLLNCEEEGEEEEVEKREEEEKGSKSNKARRRPFYFL